MQVIPTTDYRLKTIDLRDKVFVYPTDTCYGIGCSVFDEAALKRVYQAKGRNFFKPVNIMVDSLEMFERYGELSSTARKLARAFLPGDITLLVKRRTPSPLRGASPRKRIFPSAIRGASSGEERKIISFLGEGGRRPEGVGPPSFTNPNQDLIGIRIPNHAFCLSLVKTLGHPVVTTSANVAGQPETYAVSDVLEAFNGDNTQIDLIFDGGILGKNPPSTIVKVVGDSWEVIRQGRIGVNEIQACVREA